MPGLRAELAVDEPLNCPVAVAAGATDGRARSVSWTRSNGGDVVEEFELDGPVDPDALDVDLEAVFEHDDGTVYRMERDADAPCVCSRLEEMGCPVTETRAADGRLYVTLHAADADELRTVVADLQGEFGDVELRYLVRTGGGGTDGDPVVVDRGRLTDRQREVLERAHGMGYFDYPRGANATEVAASLDIDQSTLAEHLAAAQSKLLDAVVEE